MRKSRQVDRGKSRETQEAAGSPVAFGFSRFGGGLVDQKWRPHLGQTQNWSGAHGIPGPGSRMSMLVPQRWHRMRRSTSLISAILAYFPGRFCPQEPNGVTFAPNPEPRTNPEP